MSSRTNTDSVPRFVDETSLSFGESGAVNSILAAPCPLTYAPPFMAPFKRDLDPEHGHRLTVWLDELLPGEPVAMVEWVGTDLRQPLHAVVVSFRLNNRPALVLVHKVEEIERRHLVQAIDGVQVEQSVSRIVEHRFQPDGPKTR